MNQANNRLSNMSLLCAILVAMIHCTSSQAEGSVAWYLSQLLFDGVTGIAVPFFFLVSGFFLGRHDVEGCEYISELKKRIRSIVFPFYLWNTMFWLFGLCLIVVANVLHGTELTRNLSYGSLIGLTGFGLRVSLTPLCGLDLGKACNYIIFATCVVFATTRARISSATAPIFRVRA